MSDPADPTARPADPSQAPLDTLLDEVAEHDTGWWHALLHPSRRGWMLIISAGTTMVLIGIAFLLPVPFVKLAPGPTFNVIGEDDGRDVIEITGTETFPVDGSLDMTTVLESGGPRGGLTFVDAIASWLDPADAVVPRELLFPDDVSGEDVQKRQALLFSTSESNAVAAAMDYLDQPVDVRVVVNAVYPDTPSDGLLLPKDELVSIDGVEVDSAQQVVEAVRSQPIGTTFDLVIRRDGVEVDGVLEDGVEQDVELTSVSNPEDPEIPLIGIGVGELYSAPFPIDFTLAGVGGPSAGLIFATGIIDKLTPGSLTGGNYVAGTGTIDPDGTVGTIGGIRQKLAGARDAGATLFLVPAGNCDEAVGHIPDGLTVVPVETLTEAVTVIEDYAAGKPVGACPTPVS